MAEYDLPSFIWAFRKKVITFSHLTIELTAFLYNFWDNIETHYSCQDVKTPLNFGKHKIKRAYLILEADQGGIWNKKIPRLVSSLASWIKATGIIHELDQGNKKSVKFTVQASDSDFTGIFMTIQGAN